MYERGKGEGKKGLSEWSGENGGGGGKRCAESEENDKGNAKSQDGGEG